MSKRPTVRTVAEEAGVSTATVSNVLAGRRDRVSPATIDKVLRIVDRLGYRPNPSAQAVRTGRTNLVLLSLGALSDPWTQDVAAAVADRLRPRQLHALVLPDGDWDRILDRQPAELAFLDDVSETQRPALERLVARGLPVIVFSEHLTADGYDVVASPHLPGCRLAVRHLIENHHRIGCLAGIVQGRRGLRHGVFVEEMAAAGREIREEWVADYTSDPIDAFRAALRVMDREDRPDALFATTDFAAIAAVRAAQQLRLEVGKDIAIIGAGNTREGARMEPSLSSVGPLDFFSRLADLVEHRLDNPAAPPVRHVFDWQLVRRSSA